MYGHFQVLREIKVRGGEMGTGLTRPVRDGIHFTKDSDSAPGRLQVAWLPEVE